MIVAMADENEDPREVPWHPRFAPVVVGHDVAVNAFKTSFDSGRPHHAWLITGPSGVGKASFAYDLARHVLSLGQNRDQVQRWVHARAHPDLVVLERTFNDSKSRKLRTEISVDDGRRFIDFFARTSSSGGWRVGLVDAADDLNTESANALLKLVEEPPAKTLILLACHAPGKLLRTLRSRCRMLPLSALTEQQTSEVLLSLPLEPAPDVATLQNLSRICGGRPGFALQLMGSEGAKAFQAFVSAKRLDAATRNAIGQHFATRALAQHDFEVFMGLFLEWLASQAKTLANPVLAALYSDLGKQRAVVGGYNLDRRTAVMDILAQVDQALKAA
jgi:DNA polymerase III subunit delta'